MRAPAFLSFTFSILAASAISSVAELIGGIDPATAPVGLTDGTFTNFTVIGKTIATTDASGMEVDLVNSTFTFQSNSKGAASARPFIAVQNGGGIHRLSSYDIVWMGTPLNKGAAGVDVSASLGAGSISLPANATIVGGYWSSESQSPVSYTDNSGSGDDTLILAETFASVAGDFALTGTDWSTNASVADRDYHYLIDLQAVQPDSDGDGLPDPWETEHNLDPDDNGEDPNNNGITGDPENGALGDPDGDLLNNLGEYDNRTDPRDDDSDDDMLLDNEEILGAGLRPPTSPLSPDSDADGLTDLVETNTGIFVSDTDTGSNPQLRDSDGDTIDDGAERSGGNPGGFTSDPNKPDTDGDGTPDNIEYAEGTDPDDAASFPTAVFIGDSAPQGSAVSDRATPDTANAGNITYALHGFPYTNASGGPEEFVVSKVNFWADNSGDITPFVAVYNGQGVGFGSSYIVRAVGDIITATAGATNKAAFTVNGSPVSITLMDGETLVAGFHQSAGVVPFATVAGTEADYLSQNPAIGAVGSTLFQDANWSTLERIYAFNIALEPAVTQSFAIIGIDLNLGAGSATVTWKSVSGRKYQVWASSDLITWSELTDNALATGTTASYSESPLPPNTVKRFYQIRFR